jgi:DNA-binding Lrp family transcriptional regulator
LKLFLDELKESGCIVDVSEFWRVSQSYHNTPSRELLLHIRKALSRGQLISFNWEKWVEDFDEVEEATLPEEKIRRIPFSYEDLLTLFQLEQNLRIKFVDMAKIVGESSAKIAKRYRDILRKRLVIGCRVDISPVDPLSAVHLLLKLDFTNGVMLRKFVSRLNQLPYPVTYQKLIEEDSILLHTMVPSPEYFDFHNSLEALNRGQGITRAISLYISHFYAKFDNIKLFEAFSRRNNKWAFSIDVMRRALNRLLKDTRFQF